MLRYCYYINLDKRTDRKEHIENELSKSEQLNQIYQRFPAVDGTIIHPRSVREGLLTENAICDILANKISAWGLSLTQGGLGVLLSYLALFDEISKLDSPAIVFEDDSVLVDNFDEKLDKITSQLPDDFDICYLGYADMPIQKEYYSEDLSIPKGMIVCLPSIIVSPAGAEKLLNLLNNIDNQVDTAIYHHLDKLNAFVSNEKIVNIPNELGTDIQGNINCGKKYKTQNYIIATLAHGDFPNDNVIRLARDLRYFDQKLLVVTNKPELFSTLENVIVVKYPDKRFSYNDKIICFEEGFKIADAVVYVDSDTRVFYENYKHTYGNFLRIIDKGFHPSWDWGKITRSDNNRFFNSTDVAGRVSGYGELALDICNEYKINYDEAFHYQEGFLIISKDDGKEELFLKMWKHFANKLDEYEIKSNANRIGVGEGNLIGLSMVYSGMKVNDHTLSNLLGQDLKYNFFGSHREDYFKQFPNRKTIKNSEGKIIFEKNIIVNFDNKKIDLFYNITEIEDNVIMVSYDWNKNNVVDFLDHEFKVNGNVYHFNSEKNNEFYFNKTDELEIYHTYDWYGDKNWELIYSSNPKPTKQHSETYARLKHISSTGQAVPESHLQYLYRLRDEFHFYPNVIYDIGSCILHWSKYAKEVWQHADIILFDAMEELEELYLETDYRYNIDVISDADNKELTFYKNVSYPGGNSYYIENPEYSDVAIQLFHNPENKSKRRAYTLDTIIKKRGFPYPDLIKIDVQGAEIDVLRGATDVLNHTKHLIVELQHEQYNIGANLYNVSIPIIESMGFDLITPKFSLSSDSDADYHFMNKLYKF